MEAGRPTGFCLDCPRSWRIGQDNAGAGAVLEADDQKNPGQDGREGDGNQDEADSGDVIQLAEEQGSPGERDPDRFRSPEGTMVARDP